MRKSRMDAIVRQARDRSVTMRLMDLFIRDQYVYRLREAGTGRVLPRRLALPTPMDHMTRISFRRRGYIVESVG